MSLDLFSEMRGQQEFLGWDTPLLPNVARFLVERHRRDERLDLSRWICVLPSTQSAIRFGERLKSLSQSLCSDYRAPRIVTAGDLAETLYQPEQPIAIEFEQTLAWARVLRHHNAESLRPLLPVLPESDALGPWLELAGTLRRLSADLASHAVTFSDVISVTESEPEQQRWELLQLLYESYLSELSTAGLSDQHQQRRRAVAQRRVRSPGQIALVGTSDLNESIAKLLAEVEQDVVAFIAAPEQHCESFDWMGRLKTEAFTDFRLPIRDEHLVTAGEIADQATAVSESVTELSSRFRSAEIAVGVTDPSHVAPTEMQLEGCGFSTFRHIGWTVASTSVGRLIDLTASLLARPTWRSLAAIIRHADLHRYLKARLEGVDDDFLIQVDQLMANHLPIQLSAPLPPVAIKNYPVAIETRDLVLAWLSPLLASHQLSDAFYRTRPIAEWCLGMLELIDSVYASEFRDQQDEAPRRMTVDAIVKVKELLTRFAKLSRHLDVPVTAAAALETLAARLAELRVTTELSPDAVQIHGWLDLALDDSPAMVVIGFNHPFVPSAVTSDPFLPGTLRAKLRLSDNERRYARDLYATQLMLSTRKEIRLIVGRKAADGSPTPPSRLLAAATPDALARRIRTLLGGSRQRVTIKHQWDTDLEQTNLPIPDLTTTDCPVRAMSVTAFKAYLECPYRFYLRHVLQLKPLDDAARELAANQFGDLVHGAVEYFGKSDARDESDPGRIFEALRYYLNHYANEHYGDQVESAVTLQIRQAERRLQFVADEQARRIGDGWRIHATEASVEDSKGACITVDGKKMGLRGRFDRIDRNLQTGQWAILDYKTHGHKPEKKHLRKDRETGAYEWVDLQLPLYRMMIPFLGIEAPPDEVQLGYFNVSDKADETRINIADFGPALLDQADEVIRQCVRRIFACDFSPSPGRVLYDDYDMILQTGVASRMLAVASADEAGEDE